MTLHASHHNDNIHFDNELEYNENDFDDDLNPLKIEIIDRLVTRLIILISSFFS
jgi:hypothetical protein